jgi:hypothetical protein
MNPGAPRLIVVVVAVLAGILILTQGFEGSAEIVEPKGSNPPSSPSATPTTTGVTGNTTGPTTTGGNGNANGPTGKQDGVVVAIYNATSTNGLACSAETDLKKKGYVIAATGNFPTATVTTIYYKGEKGGQGEADAQLLKQEATPETKVKKLPNNLPADSDIPTEAELVMVLGTDYAASHSVPPTC